MALTKSFKELVQKRVAAEPAFGEALLRDDIDTMLAGDLDTGQAILRDYIKATIGFERLGAEVGTQPKSLMRMFGASGNPQARNLFRVLGHLQKCAGLELHVGNRQTTKQMVFCATTHPHRHEALSSTFNANIDGLIKLSRLCKLLKLA